MTLATSGPDGQPSARVVSLMHAGEDGFTFYTNYRSGKGRELALNPRAALLFHWPEIGRQVRVTGLVEQIGRTEAEAQFEAQPRQAQLSAWASWQSSQIADREFLAARFKKMERKFGGDSVPAPGTWGGYRVRPETIEFSQNRSDQLHDRLQYSRGSDGRWSINRLAP